MHIHSSVTRDISCCNCVVHPFSLTQSARTYLNCQFILNSSSFSQQKNARAARFEAIAISGLQLPRFILHKWSNYTSATHYLQGIDPIVFVRFATSAPFLTQVVSYPPPPGAFCWHKHTRTYHETYIKTNVSVNSTHVSFAIITHIYLRIQTKYNNQNQYGRRSAATQNNGLRKIAYCTCKVLDWRGHTDCVCVCVSTCE